MALFGGDEWTKNHPAILAHAAALGYKRATGISYPPVESDDPGYKGVWTSWADSFNSWKAAELAKPIPWWVANPGGDSGSGDGDGDGDGDDSVGGADRHPPSTVPSEVFSPTYERPGLLDWSRFMPTDSRNILGGGYMDPSLLASQRSITAGDGRYYQPWAQGGVANTGASGIWDYSPPATSLFSPFGQPLNIRPVSYFTLPESGNGSGTKPEDDDDDDDGGNTDGTGGDGPGGIAGPGGTSPGGPDPDAGKGSTSSGVVK